MVVNVSGPDGGFVVDYLKEDGNANTSQGELAFSSETGNATYRISLTDDAGNGFATKIWRFDGTGNLNYPDGTISTGGATYAAANASVQMISNNAYNQVQVDDSNVYIYTSLNGISLQEWKFTGSGDLTAPGNISATGNVAGDVALFNDVNINNVTTNKLLYANDDRNVYDTNFGYESATGNISGTGNITTTANVTAAYFIGDGSQLTGLPASYGNANVVANLAALSSNPISTTGNITAGNFIGSGSNVELVAQTEQWVFDTLGVLTLPGEGVLRSVDDSVTLQSFNTTTGNANSVYLGSSGGLGFLDQEIGGNWLEIFRSGAEPEIRVPVGRGNLNVQTAEGANVYNWTFDNTGNLTLPTEGYLLVQTGIIGAGASPAPTLSGFSSIATTGSPGNISASGNLLASGYANITGNVNGSGATFSGNVTAQNFVGNISITGNVQGTSANVTLVAGSYSTVFDNTGTATFPGNIVGNTAGFAIGYRDIPQVSFTGDATLAATAAGKHYYSTLATANTLTIANNTSVSWTVGTAITVVNRGTGNITVAQGSGVSLYLAGNSSAGNRTVTTYGMATLLNVAANVWMINGTGVV